MARFSYRMQNILNIKLRQEEQQKTAFGIAQRKLNDEEEKLAQLIARREGYVVEGREMRKRAISVYDLSSNRDAVNVMDEIIAGQRIAVMRAQKNLEVERQRLTEAMQERKMHERLREKAYERFLEEDRKEDR